MLLRLDSRPQAPGLEGIHVLPSPVFNAHRPQLIDLAARYPQSNWTSFR